MTTHLELTGSTPVAMTTAKDDHRETGAPPGAGGFPLYVMVVERTWPEAFEATDCRPALHNRLVCRERQAISCWSPRR